LSWQSSPMEVCWKILLPRPILVGPLITTWELTQVLSPISTSAPMTVKGPISTPLPMTADSWTMAVSWMMAV